ncbi:MAG: energy transducer TonB [Chthoniobacterales bacterium]
MAGPLLYKPSPKWHVIAAFSGAVAVHAIAVGIAGLKPEEPPVDLGLVPEVVAEATLDLAQPEPTPEEIEEPLPIEAPPEPTEVPEFVEEKATPPPKRDRPAVPIQPIARPTAPASGKAALLFKPHIEYPYEARRSKITGSGEILVTVTPDGSVSSVSMAKSCGNPILDNTCTSAFQRARFKPGTAPRVRIPITFTLSGASY